MKLSAKTGVALTITALSLVVTVGAGASDSSDSVDPVDAWVIHCCTYGEEGLSTLTPLPTFFVTPPSTAAAHVGMMNQLRNLTEPNAIKWGWSQGLANDQASAGMTRYSGGTAQLLTR